MRHCDESFGRIISCIHRQAHIYFERELAPFNLGSGTLPVLMHLLHHDGINQQELSRHLHVDKATTTRTVGKLLKAGYVRRETDTTDHRAYRLFVTSEARKIEPEIRKVLHFWTTMLAEGFTPEEKGMALTLLQRMRDNALKEKKS